MLKSSNIILINLGYWNGWIDIIQTLAVDGVGAVTMGQLKPYISIQLF